MSCGFNPVCWVLGDPAPAGPRQRFDAAVKALHAARARGDKPAERAALAQMQAASNEMRKAAGQAVKTVHKIDKTVADAKAAVSGFSTKTMMAISAAVLLMIILKR